MLMIKPFLFLKRNRLRKKGEIYKLLLAISLDMTTMFYSLLLIGYFAVAFYFEGQVPTYLIELMNQFATILEGRIWLIVTIIPIAYLYDSIKRPGVLFSSAEYMLTILPYERKHVWVLVAIDKWLKS